MNLRAKFPIDRRETEFLAISGRRLACLRGRYHIEKSDVSPLRHVRKYYSTVSCTVLSTTAYIYIYSTKRTLREYSFEVISLL